VSWKVEAGAEVLEPVVTANRRDFEKVEGLRLEVP